MLFDKTPKHDITEHFRVLYVYLFVISADICDVSDFRIVASMAVSRAIAPRKALTSDFVCRDVLKAFRAKLLLFFCDLMN